MGKISPVSAKYIINSQIQIEGIVERPDIIGAVFGQTEGLLGPDLELRELQRSGRIGRIDVNSGIKSGKTYGEIVIPSSLDKAETVIVAAALETIERIGPCNAKVKIGSIEDVRTSKRNFVISRAKELLKELTNKTLPDSQEITDEVTNSIRIMEITEYGTERLSAGPNIEDAEEVIVVEGRADVLNLLKHGIKNVIAINGTRASETIVELSKKKTITLFMDGDRGGELNVKNLLEVAEIDYVCRAPDGKEVEELTKKEILKALRGKIVIEQAKLEFSYKPNRNSLKSVRTTNREIRQTKKDEVKLSDEETNKFRAMADDLIGTRGAYVIDKELSILGKVPTTELVPTIKSLKSGVYAILLDGDVNLELAKIAGDTEVKYIVSTDLKTKVRPSKTIILKSSDL